MINNEKETGEGINRGYVFYHFGHAMSVNAKGFFMDIKRFRLDTAPQRWHLNKRGSSTYTAWRNGLDWRVWNDHVEQMEESEIGSPNTGTRYTYANEVLLGYRTPSSLYPKGSASQCD